MAPGGEANTAWSLLSSVPESVGEWEAAQKRFGEKLSWPNGELRNNLMWNVFDTEDHHSFILDLK